MFTYNSQSAGARKSSVKKSKRSPSKKQLAALARGRAIRAKNIKKRSSGKKKQRGGARPLTALELHNRDAEKRRRQEAQEEDERLRRQAERARVIRREEQQRREEDRQARSRANLFKPWLW